MYTSDKFFEDAQRLGKHKDLRGAPESKIIAEIRNLFFTSLPDLPEPLLHDIYNYYVEKYFAKDEVYDSFFQILEEISPVIDLFEECYDEKVRKLPEDDWVFIRDVVSEYGDHLELSTISSIMTLVVDHKGFS